MKQGGIMGRPSKMDRRASITFTAVLADRGEVGSGPAEGGCTFSTTERTGDLLLNFHHAQIPFRLVVGERNPEVMHERRVPSVSGWPAAAADCARPRFLGVPGGAGGGGLAASPALMILRYSAAKRRRSGRYNRRRPSCCARSTAACTVSSNSLNSPTHGCVRQRRTAQLLTPRRGVLAPRRAYRCRRRTIPVRLRITAARPVAASRRYRPLIRRAARDHRRDVPRHGPRRRACAATPPAP